MESVEAVLARFDSAGMSLGALSPEAHEALAIAMNRLGARSNSGEGGEDPARYRTEKNSKIKQVASGRFGVTPEYLINAEVLQIKVAQGAKPGEGGQLPGHKVNDMIASLRFARPGVGLISPPPHHDIYSIEDLAQLIFDLKQVNPQALVSVKLVAEPGVGTVAAGVAKAYADLITISGYDGGTGASPLSSIKYAGTPWELGLAGDAPDPAAERPAASRAAADRRRAEDRSRCDQGGDHRRRELRVRYRADGGARLQVPAHLPSQQLRDRCRDSTQRAALEVLHRAAGNGHELLPVRGPARCARSWRPGRAQPAGPHRADASTCRSSRVRRRGSASWISSPILSTAGMAAGCAAVLRTPSNAPFDKGELAERMVRDMLPAIEGKKRRRVELRSPQLQPLASVRACPARSPGAGVTTAWRIRRWPCASRATSGQSFGVWNAGGLHLYLEGDANDYVGKGMAGGKIVLRHPRNARYVAKETIIMGNTCLYGATGGQLFAAGVAGERFAVRNSGAIAVIEGAGDHCCEYMTGGVVCVFGRTGVNFGAGFTGGFAYVLDLDRDFVDRYNHELIDISRIHAESMQSHLQHLESLLEQHVAETGSAWAEEIVNDLRSYIGKFWVVKPKAASIDSLIENLRRAA